MNNPGGSWAIDFVNRVMKYRSTIPENLRRTIRIFTLLYRYITHMAENVVFCAFIIHHVEKWDYQKHCDSVEVIWSKTPVEIFPKIQRFERLPL